MKVLMLTRYARLGASSRLRSWQYLPWLHAAGMSVQVHPLFDDDYLLTLYATGKTAWTRVAAGYLARLHQVLCASRHDLVIVEKELFPWLPAFAETLLRRAGIPMVVDYDDAIFHHYDMARNPLKRLLARKIDRVMAAATVVVCGNDYLAARARAAGAQQTVLIPTSVDLEHYPLAPAEPSPTCRIGWIGTPRTVHYLQALAPVLQQVAKRLPLRLVVVGARLEVPGLEVECRAWSEAGEAAEISNVEIGIMPLDDTPWERGKCAYKLIQAMACGRPVIGSRVGANCSVVKEGVNGFLAGGHEEWKRAIETLASDPDLRQRQGQAGRRMVEEHYCLDKSGPFYTQVCLHAARREPVTGSLQGATSEASLARWRAR